MANNEGLTNSDAQGNAVKIEKPTLKIKATVKIGMGLRATSNYEVEITTFALKGEPLDQAEIQKQEEQTISSLKRMFDKLKEYNA